MVDSPYERTIFNIKLVTEISSDQKTTIGTKQSWWLDHYRSYNCSSYFPKSFKVWFQSVSEKNCLFTNGNFFYRFSGYSQNNGNRRIGFNRLSATIAVQVGLWVRSSIDECIWISPGNWEARVGMGNGVTIAPPITPFADTSTPVTSHPVSPWCSEQTPENRWGEISKNNLCYIWSLCERLWNLFCVLGCFVVTVELQFII